MIVNRGVSIKIVVDMSVYMGVNMKVDMKLKLVVNMMGNFVDNIPLWFHTEKGRCKALELNIGSTCW